MKFNNSGGNDIFKMTVFLFTGLFPVLSSAKNTTLTEQEYLNAALDNLPVNGQFGNPWKQFALSMHNAAMCIGELHRVMEKE